MMGTVKNLAPLRLKARGITKGFWLRYLIEPWLKNVKWGVIKQLP